MANRPASIGSGRPWALPQAFARLVVLVLALAAAGPIGWAVTLDFRLPLPDGEEGVVELLPYTESGFVFHDVFGSSAAVITTNQQGAEMDSFLAMAWSAGDPAEIRVTQEANALFSLRSVDYSHLGSGRLQFISSKGGSFETSQLGSSGNLNFRFDPLWRGITGFSITGVSGAGGEGDSYWNEALFPSMELVPISYRYSGGSGLWSGTSNWVRDAPPVGDEVAVSFIGPGGFAVNDLPAGRLGSLYSLDFATAAGPYVVGSLGANELAIGEGGIVNASSEVQTILDDVSIGDGATIDVGPGGMDFVGSVSLMSNVVITGAGTANVAAVSGVFDLTKTGSGTLQLTSSSHVGMIRPYLLRGLDVREGVLEVGPGTGITVNGTMSLGSGNSTLLVTLGAESAARGAAVNVGGPAILSGTLRVGLDADFTPAVGDRFKIIAADELQGRFQSFEAPMISGTSFLGLNYQRALSESTGSLAEVITLEAPRTLAGGHLTGRSAENLVVIAHGYGSSANTFIPMADAIQFNATQAADVAILDWSSFAGGDKLPLSAAENGVNIGEALGDWLKQRGISGYTNVQLMGHSAGTWLVNSLAGKIREQSPLTNIQMTLFDSYVPGGVFRQGVNDLTVSDIGRSADFVEQYFHDGSLPWTQTIMPRAINIDVTAQEPEGGDILTGHDFPYLWYADSAFELGSRRYAGLGYGLSVVTTGSVPAQGGLFSPGNSIVLAAPDPNDPDNWALVQKSVTLQEAINPLTSAPVTTGDVVIDPQGATLRTNSPAMLTMLADLAEPANGFRFDMAFLNDALGNLAVYLDGTLLAEWDNQWFAGITDSFESGWISTGDLDLGAHTLIFRLDNLTDTQSILRIEEITFGTLVFIPVPEPSTCAVALAGIACAGFTMWRLRGRGS